MYVEIEDVAKSGFQGFVELLHVSDEREQLSQRERISDGALVEFDPEILESLHQSLEFFSGKIGCQLSENVQFGVEIGIRNSVAGEVVAEDLQEWVAEEGETL